ncbi:MAG TPA: saccharopine dehydrogenase NADP-binding domain-containing protein [Ktedonobacteraceae bacterium]|nr:saccharopine dehydrogenase NADP-binding domain-containing protein [Ktedonobacteraceae bacterium]HXZ06327.1 saccharopine dehydrogenase NADP-binding domain-containing protein [Ktedonobacteraceae bacterium]
MHIIVLGGAGAMGRIAVRTLTDYADIDQITIADYNEERAREVAVSLHSSNIEVKQIDVNDEERLQALLRGADVVLNAVEYVFNLPVLKACIKERVHYADLGGLFHMTRRLMNMHDEVSSAGITAILGMGGTPGITNVLARAAVDWLDRVESIKVQLGCSDDTPSSAPLVAPYSIRTILDEFTKQPQVFQDGIWYPQQPLSGQEEMVFPLPVGRATAVYSLHSECATFPISFHDKGIQYVSFKIAFPTDFMTKLKFLVDLGFGSDEPINVRGVKVSPREMLARLMEMVPIEDVEPQDCDVLRIVAHGEVEGQRVEITNQIVVLPYRRWGISAGALDTGTPLAIAGHMLATGEITRRGAFGPEMCIPVGPFFKELSRYDMQVTETRAVVIS